MRAHSTAAPLLAMALTSKAMPYKYKFGAAILPGIFRAHYPYCYRCPWGKEYPDCQASTAARPISTEEFFKYHVQPRKRWPRLS